MIMSMTTTECCLLRRGVLHPVFIIAAESVISLVRKQPNTFAESGVRNPIFADSLTLFAESGVRHPVFDRQPNTFGYQKWLTPF